MEAFKNLFNRKYVKGLAIRIQREHPNFDSQKFQKLINKELETLELKDRVRLISNCLNKTLPFDYKKNLAILIRLLPVSKSPEENEEKERFNSDELYDFAAWPIAQYIEDFGLDYLQESIQGMIEVTQRFTSEFAIRPYLIKHEKVLFKNLRSMKKHESHHVRRLVSEGTRPKLPWGIKVPNINNNLERNLKLIFSLRLDDSLYVRRSMANHLNDISYLDEELLFCYLEKMGSSKKEEWVKRHATRSLLKKGHPKALKMHGYSPNIRCSITQKLSRKKIKEGDSFEVEVTIKTSNVKDKKALIEYIIYYPKKNQSLSAKVFRLKDTTLNGDLTIKKLISFKKVTTRTHYPGAHYIEIQINGVKHGRTKFILLG